MSVERNRARRLPGERIWKAHNKVFCGYLSVLHKRIEISCVGVPS